MSGKEMGVFNFGPSSMPEEEMNHVPEEMKDIECPICLKLMVPPIMQCENSHPLCSTCREKLKECGLCRGKLTNKRKYEAENLSRNLKYPCRFHESGCIEKHFLLSKEEHESCCTYRHRKCPKCIRYVAPKRLKEHILNDLEAKIFPLNTPQVLTLDSSYSNTYEAWVAGDDVFIVHMESISNSSYMGDRSFNNVYCAYVGSAEEARKYKYKITLNMPDKHRFMTTSFSAQCLSFLETIDTGMNDDTCVYIPNEVVNKYLGPRGNITFEIKISKM